MELTLNCRLALRVMVEGIMEAEVSLRIGAGYRERTAERVAQRNGYRSRAWDTRVGTVELQIPDSGRVFYGEREAVAEESNRRRRSFGIRGPNHCQKLWDSNLARP